MLDLKNLPARLTRTEASEYLKARHGVVRTPNTLAKLAYVGGGPMFRKSGPRRTLYDIAELDRWADGLLSKPMANTSQFTAIAA